MRPLPHVPPEPRVLGRDEKTPDPSLFFIMLGTVIPPPLDSIIVSFVNFPIFIMVPAALDNVNFHLPQAQQRIRTLLGFG